MKIDPTCGWIPALERWGRRLPLPVYLEFQIDIQGVVRHVQKLVPSKVLGESLGGE